MSVREPLKNAARRLLSVFKWQKSALANIGQPVPIYARLAPAGLKVHLGAGEVNLQGWINVDARPFAHIHSQTNSLEMSEFADGAVGAIYLCHVLEHISFEEVPRLLSIWNRKLTRGGLLLISVPDFDALIRIYEGSQRDLDSIKFALLGGQGYEYNFHKSVYNRQALVTLLTASGFTDAMPWVTEAEFGCNLGDWSSATARTLDGQTIPLSLNVKARKA